MTSFDTQHTDMIHDCQMDFYGKLLATCSSDHTIKVFDVLENDALSQVAHLKGHNGPVWQVSWAHPKFGKVLASASYDKQVIIWRQDQSGNWSIWYQHNAHALSVNSVAWAPSEYGLMLACGSSDGQISILSHQQDNWTYTKIAAHKVGVNAVSWADSIDPAAAVSATPQTNPPPKRLASGGSDGVVNIWISKGGDEWERETQLTDHNGQWVRDVAWATNIGLPYSTIASGDQSGTVCIFTKDFSNGASNGPWRCRKLPPFSETIWKLSWSVTGNILAVSSGENKVTLWKESLEQDGEWKEVSNLNASNQPAAQ